MSAAAPTPAKSDQPGYTVALVQQAIDRYDANGRQASIDYHNSPDSVDGEWYVFIYDENHVLVSTPHSEWLGQELKGNLGVDVTGYRYGVAIMAATEDGHWVDYVFNNPATGNHEYKHSWVIKRDGLTFGSGWYQVLPGFTE